MSITDHGLVLRETRYGESHRILTILTQQHGILSVTAKGSMNPKSQFFSAAGLYCYSEWVLQEGRKTFFAKEATPLETFFGLRKHVETVYLAAYLAELTQFFSPIDEECKPLLRLLLNSFFLLSREKKEPLFVKTVFEMRSMSEHGFMPDLQACHICEKTVGGPFFFLPADGSILCEACGPKSSYILSEAALLALRHIIYAEDKQLFSFTLKDEALRSLHTVSQQYVLQHLHTAPRTLSMLEPLLNGESSPL